MATVKAMFDILKIHLQDLKFKVVQIFIIRKLYIIGSKQLKILTAPYQSKSQVAASSFYFVKTHDKYSYRDSNSTKSTDGQIEIS